MRIDIGRRLLVRSWGVDCGATLCVAEDDPEGHATNLER